MPKTASKVLLFFGATGDLARRYVYPALRALKRSEEFAVIGLGRRYATHDEFVAREGLPFPGFEYVRFDVADTDPAVLEAAIERATPSGALDLYSYLSLPPKVFGATLDALRALHERIAQTRELHKYAILEKPFGEDAASARALQAQLLESYSEDEIFRIDHYLGKEFVLNLLNLRFSNDLIYNLWNARYIDHIQIMIDEEGGIEGREGYYASAGALKDMVQNHILQLVMLLTMEAPVSFDAKDIAEEKIKAARRIRPIEEAIFGRYADLNEDTHTLAALKLETDGPRTGGVPIYIRTGKKLRERFAAIYVQFSSRDLVMSEHPAAPNALLITIQPEMRIEFLLNVKDPADLRTNVQSLTYNHAEAYEGGPTPYERVFAKILATDKLLFPTFAETLRSWELVDDLLARLDTTPFEYAAGQTPREVERFIERDGRSWIR